MTAAPPLTVLTAVASDITAAPLMVRAVLALR